MGTAEITGLAKAFQDYGAWVLVVLMGLAIIALWKRCNNRDDKLIEFAMAAVAAEKESKASADKMADAAREMATALNRLADKVAVRP